MSHFTVLVVLPKEGLEKFEDSNEHSGDDEWRNAYNHQWFHPQLEGALAPYNEQPENESDYIERDEELNERASKIYASYMNKDWTQLAEDINEEKDRREGFERKADVSDRASEGGFRKYTESEIATKLEPFDKIYQLMASEKFDLNKEEHQEIFKELFCYSSEIVWSLDDNNEIYDVFYSNPYAKWDWWVVGGRWRRMGDNGLFSDLSEFTKEEQIPFWKEELGTFKLHDIEKELDIDRDNISKEEYDKAIEEYLNDKNNKIVRFWDTSEGTGDKAIPKEYYNNQDLLSMVTRKKESTWAMLFPEEGWIEAGEMGWFGMSSLDSKDLDEKEEAIRDQNALTDNLIEKYKDTHIGLVVDCHI